MPDDDRPASGHCEVSYRCTVCGMDVTDPEHKPEICKAVAQSVAREDVRNACRISPTNPSVGA